MGTITEALECSLKKCSLSSHLQTTTQSISSSDSSNNDNDDDDDNNKIPSSIHQSTSLDLNSHLSLPYHWEQCLDLKTGEIYYINWRNGMKAKEDPRSTREDDQYSEDYCYYYSDDDDESSYDSEESSTESSNNNNNKNKKFVVEEEEEEKDVLVVGGCKRCLMYFMVPKHLEDCPKCNGQLLHFDRS